MLTHAQIWTGIDELARRHSLSPSGLAKLAGLDPTTFNKSKRLAPEGGKARWPSTESIAKALEATGASFQEFAALATGDGEARGRPLPVLSFAEASQDGLFDAAGFPVLARWRRTAFPGEPIEGLFGLEITGPQHAPVYRPGDRVIAAPGQPVRRGDRVVVRMTGGEVLAKELGRVTATAIELLALNPADPASHADVADIAWIARVLWVSQ